MATAFAKAGLTHQVEYILEAVETVIGEAGLISEEVDARDMRLLGNTPLVFSLVEYVRAAMSLDKAKPVQKWP
jgi:GH15 family glucan-1,4-alpha-glucosidase